MQVLVSFHLPPSLSLSPSLALDTFDCHSPLTSNSEHGPRSPRVVTLTPLVQDMGAVHLVGVFFLLAATALLVIVSVSVPVWNSIYFLRADLSSGASSSSRRWTWDWELTLIGENRLSLDHPYARKLGNLLCWRLYQGQPRIVSLVKETREIPS